MTLFLLDIHCMDKNTFALSCFTEWIKLASFGQHQGWVNYDKICSVWFKSPGAFDCQEPGNVKCIFKVVTNNFAV